MATLATRIADFRSVVVNDPAPVSDEAAWAAVMARDRTMDGRFVTGVFSTGIYCRPSCRGQSVKGGVAEQTVKISK